MSIPVNGLPFSRQKGNVPFIVRFSISWLIHYLCLFFRRSSVVVTKGRARSLCSPVNSFHSGKSTAQRRCHWQVACAAGQLRKPQNWLVTASERIVWHTCVSNLPTYHLCRCHNIYSTSSLLIAIKSIIIDCVWQIVVCQRTLPCQWSVVDTVKVSGKQYFGHWI